ncbi:MAG: aspartyl protease family protein [Gemmataceae bacterium]|nr:aspartyl protease family protein [Gemmataceae bacterium]
MFTADGSVGTARVKFRLDTGSEGTHLDAKVAKALKLQLGGEYRAAGIGGEAPGRVVKFPGFTVGPFDYLEGGLSAYHGLAADLSWQGDGANGVLGFGALDPYAAVIDYPARTLYLRRPLLTAWPRLAGTWAVRSWQEEGAARKPGRNDVATFEFVDHRLKLTDGRGKVHEFALRLIPGDGVSTLLLFDPEDVGKPGLAYEDALLVKVDGGRMTVCMMIDEKAKGLPTAFAAPKDSGYALLELTNAAPAAGRKAADPLRDLLLKEGYTAVPLERDPDGGRRVAGRAGGRAVNLAVDTGASTSVFDAARLKKWGPKPFMEAETQGFGGHQKGTIYRLRGFEVGGYDTRRAWREAWATGIDLTGINKARVEHKLPPIDGLLGANELRNGSAVIDYHTDTLYLRPFADTLGPRLAGKWVGVSTTHDGETHGYEADEAPTAEFAGGRLWTTNPGEPAETAAFHVQDFGGHYCLGLFDPDAEGLAADFTYDNQLLVKLDGDTLSVLAVTDPRKAGPHLSEFRPAKKGSGLSLIEFQRAM